MEEKEIWKDIEGYEGMYQVSNMGRVRSVERTAWNGKGYRTVAERILKAGNSGLGYLVVTLCKEGENKNHLIHRLVAKAFLPNADNLPEVNHKDENKENNKAENLEWVTCSENINHGTRNKRMAEKLSKPIFGIDKVTGLIVEFPSAQEAERQLGIAHNNICACLKGKYKTAGGFYWYYADTTEE